MRRDAGWEESGKGEAAKLGDNLVKGGDYQASEIVGVDFVLGHGGEVRVLPFVSGKSTTAVIQKIQGG